MNFQFFIEKLHDSQNYKDFIEENPDSFLCSGFFIIDLENLKNPDNKTHLDFYVPPSSSKSDSKLPAHQDSQISDKQLNENSPNNKSSAKKSQRTYFEANQSQAQQGQIFSFQLEENCKLVPVKTLLKETSQKISQKLDFDLDQIKETIIKEIQTQNIKNKIQKIILSLQNKDQANFLIGTVFISGLGIVRININIDEMKITLFEKKSFLDMINILKKK